MRREKKKSKAGAPPLLDSRIELQEEHEFK
jgi:hypothetical protein